MDAREIKQELIWGCDINTPFVTSWRVVSPRLARCYLGASDKIVELKGVCKGKEIAYFVKIYR